MPSQICVLSNCAITDNKKDTLDTETHCYCNIYMYVIMYICGYEHGSETHKDTSGPKKFLETHQIQPSRGRVLTTDKDFPNRLALKTMVTNIRKGRQLLYPNHLHIHLSMP